MKKLVLFLLLLIPLAAAQPLDWFNAEKVAIQLNVSSEIEIQKKSPSGFVESLRADVFFVPKNTESTAVRLFEASPRAVITGEKARYTWENPEGSFEFGYSALVETVNQQPKVSAKIPYPAGFPSDLEVYTLPAEHVDSDNPSVIGQAAYLAQGEDDLFMLVSKLAMWSKNNIHYNMSTFTAEVSQPASWVLKNRKGVCDEITTVFIAMLRSLGIPSKFISGIAFTSSRQFPQGWGAHGWAEVYFPGTGWVPFDPTFGEFGWVDPGHVKLKESISPKEPTTVYEWRARNADVRVNDLKISATKVSSEGQVEAPLKLSLRPLKERVGFGSFNVIMLDAENLAGHYSALEFTLAKVRDMEIIGGAQKQVVLPPLGKGRIFWKVKTKENLDPKYQYELPIMVFTVSNYTAESSFHVGKWDLVFSGKDAENFIQESKIDETVPFELACMPEEDKTYDSSVDIICSVDSRKDEVQNILACQGDDCVEILLGPGKSKPVSFEYVLNKPGKYDAVVTASSEGFERTAVLSVVMLDEPRVAIGGISAPVRSKYGQEFMVEFKVARESIALPRNVVINVDGPGVQSSFPIGDLKSEQDVSIRVDSGKLLSGEAKFTITARYEGLEDYSASEEFTVFVEGVPWWKRVLGFFVGLF